MKEVIFHFSPSVRFLGLSLKILFHKNKEIKRMLSKKMTFSLMSLITLLAFAFVVPSAVTAEFAITLSPQTSATDTANPDVSFADGTQVQTTTGITIGIRSDKVVQVAATPVATHVLAIAEPTIEPNDFMVIAYNKFGGTVGVPNARSDY